MQSSSFDSLLDALADRIAQKLSERSRSNTAPAEWETIAVVATRLGVTQRSIADAGRRGDIPTSRVGGRTMVRSEDVTKWVESRATTVLPPIPPAPQPDAPEDAEAAAAVAGIEATRAARAKRGGR